MISISASATTIVDNTPAASKSWDVRTIGHGAPSSEDRGSQFYVYFSSAGFTGVCKSLTSSSTTRTVYATSTNGYSLAGSTTWNITGTNTWTASGGSGHVQYLVYCSGTDCYSKGTITRK